jgi:DNA primase large subunit
VAERVSIFNRFLLPNFLQEKIDKIKEVFVEYRDKLGNTTLPDQVTNEAFPPCMKYCFEGLLSGRRASHMERFGLTSFLVNIGMPIEDMIQLYTSVSDFDESLTRYQIEHIAGLKGNKTKYTPPTCATLRTHSICRNMDNICKQVKHPLNYYRIKFRRIELVSQPQKTRKPNKDKTQ